MAKIVKADTERWGAVIKSAKVTIEIDTARSARLCDGYPDQLN